MDLDVATTSLALGLECYSQSFGPEVSKYVGCNFYSARTYQLLVRTVLWKYSRCVFVPHLDSVWLQPLCSAAVVMTVSDWRTNEALRKNGVWWCRRHVAGSQVSLIEGQMKLWGRMVCGGVGAMLLGVKCHRGPLPRAVAVNLCRYFVGYLAF